jgi:hypothetical protein
MIKETRMKVDELRTANVDGVPLRQFAEIMRDMISALGRQAPSRADW